MAADVNARNGQLSDTTTTSSAVPWPADNDEPVSPVEGAPTTKSDASEGDGSDGDDPSDHDGAASSPDDASPAKRSWPHVRQATVAGLAVAVALAATVCWLGLRSYQSHQAQAQRQLFVQVGRQCALNLTTIDWQHAEADVQRLLDSATGRFYEQFSQREQPFIDVVKKAQSKSVGTVTEAGLESDSGDKADVLVTVSIKTTNLGATDQPPREWRMRISEEKSGGDVKISNVAFVP